MVDWWLFFLGSGWLVVCGVERGAHATTHERQGRGGFQGRDRWCYDWCGFLERCFLVSWWYTHGEVDFLSVWWDFSILRLILIGGVEEILIVCWILLDLEAGRRNKDLKVLTFGLLYNARHIGWNCGFERKENEWKEGRTFPFFRGDGLVGGLSLVIWWLVVERW